jgi:hypothetical protein
MAVPLSLPINANRTPASTAGFAKRGGLARTIRVLWHQNGINEYQKAKCKNQN